MSPKPTTTTESENVIITIISVIIYDHYRFEIPRKHLTMIFLGTLQKSTSSWNSP